GYLWSNGETTQNVYATGSSGYVVTVTNSFGCTSSSTITNITQLPAPNVSVNLNGSNTFCQGDSVILTASQSNSYLWFPGGETTQSITVKDSGQYYVQVANSAGCTKKSNQIAINVIGSSQAAISVSGPTTVCEGDTVFLSANTGQSYLWSNGATTQTIAAIYTGSFMVTVDYGSGCESTSPVQQVIVNRAPFALIQASGPTSFCDGDSVVLTSNEAESYHWFPYGDTTRSITVKQTGHYRVQTTTSGCSNVSKATSVQVSPLISAQITSNMPLIIANGGTITLNSSGSSTYNWHPGGQQTQSIQVSQAGYYYVTSGDSGVCESNSDSVYVAQASTTFQATISSANGNIICKNDSVLLEASFGSSYQWFHSGETSRSVYVKGAGTYYCIVQDPTGSGPALASFELTEMPSPNAPDISSSFSPFAGYQLTAYEPSAVSYLWSTGETTSTIYTNTSGTYSAVAFNALGCVSNQKTININDTTFQQCTKPDMLQANNITTSAAKLSWNPALTSEKFEVSYWIKNSSSKTHVTVAGNIQELQVNGLTSDTTYEWTVKSICMSGLQISDVKEFNTLDGALPCGSTPQYLSNDSITKTSANCLWQETTADKFVLRYKSTSDTSYTSVLLPGHALNRFRLDSLKQGTTYQWNIRSLCSGIASLTSTEKYFTTLTNPVCEGPKKLELTQIKPKSASIAWNINYNADTLYVYVREKGTRAVRVITVSGNPVPKSVFINNLKPETSYHVWIRSKCSFGKSSYSNVK
ncbi:MAG: hypothetical protein HKN22_07310, partial [Bacteroidia bacterium]|nr:hypothetical protein [Bacteroidia bacterium]